MTGGRVLVTGATGFVGRSLVADLTGRGLALTLATRRSPPITPGGVRWVEVEKIGRDTHWADALSDVRSVVHLAGHVHVEPERAEREAALFDEINHLGSLRLYEAAAAAGATLFVFASSVTVLGTHTRPGEPLTEASAPRPATPYARSKLAAEQALTKAAAGNKTRLVIVRPPLVVGEGVGGNLDRLLRLAAMPVPLPLGRLRNRRTLLSLDNLTSALGTILERGDDAPVGCFLLGDRAPLSTSDIVRELRAGLGRGPGLVPCPAALVARALAALGRQGLAERLFGSLEVDSSLFRETYGWSEAVDTTTSLRDAAAAWARARRRGRPGRQDAKPRAVR